MSRPNARRVRASNGRFAANQVNQHTPGKGYWTREIVHNALLSRSNWMNQLLDPRRDIDKECGYPKSLDVTTHYRQLYDRDAISRRVVEVLPEETWASYPSVYEAEEEDKETAFELAWDELCNNLRGKSWYKDQEGNPIWEALKRADKLSGIGHFGVILLGIDDGKDLREPIDGVEQGTPSRSKHKLLFLRSFDESLVDITQYEINPENPRFGQPVMYSITFNDPRDEAPGGIGITTATRDVHWTRVIHVADNLGSSEIFGTPRLKSVYNRVYDLIKLYAGSAEMYWKGAFPGVSVESHPQLGGDVDLDAASIRSEMVKWSDGLQRWLGLVGAGLKVHAPQVADPTAQIDAQITAICIEKGIPKRIFMGSERGELASSQDDSTWNDRKRDRQNSYLTPRVIVPFIDRLILIGVLPEPAEGYSVVWPDLDALTDAEEADIAVKRVEAIVKYVGGNAESLITPLDFLTRIMKLTTEEAEAILEATMDVDDEDHLTNPPDPEPEPSPIKVKDGEKLINPKDGSQISEE